MAGNIETKRKVCYFFQKCGNCKYGVNCQYIHPQVVSDSRPNKEKICFQFQKFGNCKYNSNAGVFISYHRDQKETVEEVILMK